MRHRTGRLGLLAALVWLLVALAPGGGAQAQTVCPANDPAIANVYPTNTVMTQTAGSAAQCTVTTTLPSDGIVISNYGGNLEFYRLTAGSQSIGDLTATTISPSCSAFPGTSVHVLSKSAATCTFQLGWTDANGATVSQQIGIDFNDAIESFTLGTSIYPTITSFSPAQGPAGTVVTLTGTNLSGVFAAGYGSAAANVAASFTVVSATQVRVTIPSAVNYSSTIVVVTSPANSVQTATSFLLAAPPVTLTTTSLPAATQGTSYATTLVASGGAIAVGGPSAPAGFAPYIFAATGLPSGLTLNANTGVISGTPTQAGNFNVSITASDRNSNYPSTGLGGSPDTKTLTLSVVATNQTITFPRPADMTFATGATVALTASASSGLAVTFTSLTTSVCTVSGTTATLLTVGTCTIKASQAGNASVAAAADVTQSFNATGTPALTASATVAPDKFSRPGETLVFAITLRNSGGIAATGVRLAEPRLTGISCAATTIAAGGTLACQGSTLTTAADLAAGKVTITPQLTYTYGGAAP